MHLTENQLNRNEIFCAVDYQNYVSHIMRKKTFRFKLSLKAYWQNIKFFTKLPEISHTHKSFNFNGSQLAKMKKSIPDMSLPWKL